MLASEYLKALALKSTEGWEKIEQVQFNGLLLWFNVACRAGKELGGVHHVQVLERASCNYFSRWGKCLEYLLWIHPVRWLKRTLCCPQVFIRMRWRGVLGWLSFTTSVQVEVPKTPLNEIGAGFQIRNFSSWITPFYSRCMLDIVSWQYLTLNPSTGFLAWHPVSDLTFHPLSALSSGMVGGLPGLACGHLFPPSTCRWPYSFYLHMEPGR